MDIILLDTGYVSTESELTSQTQLSTANRAGNSGTSSVTEFTLKTSSISLGGKTNTENKPAINTFTEVSTTATGIANRVMSVSAILKKEIITSGYNTNNVIELLRMSRTKGLKLLYVDSTTNTQKTIIEAYGALNTDGLFSNALPDSTAGTVSETTPYIVGRVKDMNISDTSDGNYWRVSFKFELTKQA